MTLLGYPDWLPDHLELDNYFSGVSIKLKRVFAIFCCMLRIAGIHQQILHMVCFCQLSGAPLTKFVEHQSLLDFLA